METGKTSKYFKYAIGEVILVVIGILIALQINNWNENKKKRDSWRTYTESLIKDLQQDTITLNTITKYIHNDSIYQENIIKRISSQYATIDTLINIVRYDLKINGKAYRPPNDKTFLAMQANGTVELFDKETYSLLLDLQNQQAIAGSIIKVNVDAFITQVENFVSNYSTNEFNPISGPLLEQYWVSINENELYKDVQGFLTAKKMINRNTGKQYQEVLLTTEKVLDRLIKIKKKLD
jgi:hypothetical protein